MSDEECYHMPRCKSNLACKNAKERIKEAEEYLKPFKGCRRKICKLALKDDVEGTKNHVAGKRRRNKRLALGPTLMQLSGAGRNGCRGQDGTELANEIGLPGDAYEFLPLYNDIIMNRPLRFSADVGRLIYQNGTGVNEGQQLKITQAVMQKLDMECKNIPEDRMCMPYEETENVLCFEMHHQLRKYCKKEKRACASDGADSEV